MMFCSMKRQLHRNVLVICVFNGLYLLLQFKFNFKLLKAL
jgi:hypothetical protein